MPVKTLIKGNRILIVILGLVLMLSAQYAKAYIGSAPTGDKDLILREGGIKKYVGIGIRYPNVDCARLKVTSSSHKLSAKYPLHFRLRTSDSLAVKSTKWSNLGTVQSLNTNCALRYAVYPENKLTSSKWYIWGQTDTNLSDDNTTIKCTWEY